MPPLNQAKMWTTNEQVAKNLVLFFRFGYARDMDEHPDDKY